MFSGFINAQESIIFKGKTFAATPVWNFFCDQYAFSPTLKIQIAKTAGGGILKLSIATSNNNLFIGDKVLLVLKDGSLIYCADKNDREISGTEKVTFYSLTVLEMNKLKTLNIENIRFQIVGKESKFGSKAGFFTASNKKDYIGNDENSLNFDTKTDVKSLFKL